MVYNIKEDKEYIENWLIKCVKFKKNNTIFYITNDNIIRQLKYNQLLNIKKEIKFKFNPNDINKFHLNGVILIQSLNYNNFLILMKMFSYFCDKYITNKNINQNLLIKKEIEITDYINEILCDIFNLTDYNSSYYIE